MRKVDQPNGQKVVIDSGHIEIKSQPIAASDSNSGSFICKNAEITVDELKLGKGSSAHLNKVSLQGVHIKLEGALTLVDSQIAAEDIQIGKDAVILAERSSITSNPHLVFRKKPKSLMVRQEENPQLGK